MVQAAIIDPPYHRELYIEVRGALYSGYATSVMSMGAALAARDTEDVVKEEKKDIGWLTSKSQSKSDEPSIERYGQDSLPSKKKTRNIYKYSPSSDKHANRLGSRLDDGGNNHKGSPKKYRGASAHSIGEIWSKGEGTQCTYGLHVYRE